MEYPVVTVFTLIYNTNPKFVIEAIESIKGNNYPNIQHIIIDDCSPNPEPKEIVKKWIKENKYPCEFYEHETNYGLCKTLNHVLELANGKYFFGCSDDIFMPNRIIGDVEMFESSDIKVDVLVSQCQYDDKNNPENNIIHPYFIDFDNFFEKLLNSNLISAPSVTLRTDTLRELGGYNEQFYIEDYEMWLRLALNNKKFMFRNEITTCYRVHENGMSVKKNELVQFEAFRIKMHYSKFSEVGFRNNHLKIIIQNNLNNNFYAKKFIELYCERYGKNIYTYVLSLYINVKLKRKIIQLISRFSLPLFMIFFYLIDNTVKYFFTTC